MSLEPQVLDARIDLRVAELRLMAAEIFARRTTGCLPLPGPAPTWRPQPHPPRISPGVSRLGGDGRSS